MTRLIYDALEPGNDRLPDGRRVHWQRTEFDCMTATLATALQCEYEDVPAGPDDPANPDDHRAALARLEEWLAGLGWRLEIHKRPPLNYLTWIGMDLDPSDPSMHHAVLCRGRRLVFDPALGWPGLPPGYKVQTVSKIDLAYTFQRMEPQ